MTGRTSVRSRGRPDRNKILSIEIDSLARSGFEDNKIEVIDSQEKTLFTRKTAAAPTRNDIFLTDSKAPSTGIPKSRVPVTGITSPRTTGINFLRTLPAGGSLDLSMSSGRPVTQHVSIQRKNLQASLGRPIKQRNDDMQVSSSAETSNFGKIMNFTRMAGINDKVKREDLHQWSGIPKTTRNNRVPSLNLNQAKLVAHHRRKTQNAEVLEKTTASMASANFSSNDARRNISQTAWNKIRLVELKKQDRLSFKQ